jgi:hypothetical protein
MLFSSVQELLGTVHMPSVPPFAAHLDATQDFGLQ